MSGFIGGIERPLSGGRSGIADVDPWRTMVGRRMGAFDPKRSVVIVRFRTTWDGDAPACVSFEQIVPRRSV